MVIETELELKVDRAVWLVPRTIRSSPNVDQILGRTKLIGLGVGETEQERIYGHEREESHARNCPVEFF